MPIRVECESCAYTFQAADKYAGKRIKCPKCPATLRVSSSAKDGEAEATYGLAGQVSATRVSLARSNSARVGSASPMAESRAVAESITRATRTPAQILQAFGEEIPPVRPSPMYRLWILVVAAAMILLPLIYVALIFLIGYGVFFHVTHDYTILQGTGNKKGATLVFLAPIVMGAMMIAFMIKPIFAKPGSKQKTRSLDPSKEPLLFAFVDGICASVGAPTPSRIDVDCQVNASAGLANGPLAIFNKDLVLTIGLPLVGGLTMRQFAGVLAHEFGHFSQKAGMRLTGVIRSINFWFTRVVYERDAWDEQLASWSGGGGSAMLLVLLARAAVWLTRRILWCLMMVGHIISGVMSRHMEFDADRYEARLVGGDVFESTCRRLNILNVAMQGAYADLSQTWREGKLADDLPRLVLANVAQIPKANIDAINEMIDTRITGLIDTHPADKDRIAAAKGEATDGIFKLDGPASDVFAAFDSLSRAVTFDYYRSLFGHNVTREILVPVGDLVRSQEAVQEGSQALQRVFFEAFDPYRPLPLNLDGIAVPADLKAAKIQLRTLHDEMEAIAADYIEATKRFDELATRNAQIETALFMAKADYKFSAKEFDLPASNLAAVEEAREETDGKIREIEQILNRFELAAARRIRLALCLLEADLVANRVPDGVPFRDDARTLARVAGVLGRKSVPAMIALMQPLRGMLGVLNKVKPNEQNQKLINAALRGGREVHNALQTLKTNAGGSIPYPFEHAQESITVARFLLPEIPGHDDVSGLIGAAQGAVENLISLQVRVIGRVVLAVEAVEHTLGIRSRSSQKATTSDLVELP
jgi:Zn-dependent protease with chaperone function